MVEATVRKLHEPGAAIERDGKVFNTEITFNLGKSAQGRILTDFPQSIDEDQFAGQLAMLTRQARRQQAVYDIIELEELIEQAEDQAATFQADHDEAEGDHKKKVAEFEVKIAELRRIKAEGQQTARQDAARAGKSADAKLPHQARQSMLACDKAIENAEHDQAKLVAERDLALSNLQINLRRQYKLIERLHRKIAQKKAAVDGRA